MLRVDEIRAGTGVEGGWGGVCAGGGVPLDRLEVKDKAMRDLSTREGTHHHVTKKQFCRLIKGGSLVEGAVGGASMTNDQGTNDKGMTKLEG